MIEGVKREGEKEKTTPIGPPVPDDLKATLNGTNHFKDLANDRHGAWWAAAIKLYETYPGFHFDDEVEQADLWVLSNPRRKPKDLKKFLTNWFNRTVERLRREEARNDAMRRTK